MIDGFIGLEGDGPLRGKPTKVGVLAAGDEMLSLDSACCRLVGIDPNTIIHLKHAENIGIGTITPETASVLNVKSHLHNTTFVRANEDFRKMGKLYNIRNPYTCTGCGDAISCALDEIKSKPKLWPKLATSMAFRALFGGMLLLTGKNASAKGLKGKKICIGDCTQTLAHESKLRFVSGCPPKPQDIACALLE